MTKLEIINTFLTERLMAALNEIMDMIGGTVLQYETELDTIQKDNEYLRRRLQEVEKHIESNGPGMSNSEQPASLIWTSTIETEAQPTEIYRNQVTNDQITKVEEISSHVPLVTEPNITLSSSPIKSTLTKTNAHFETSTFPCDVKTEPMENFDSQFTSTNTSAHSPLPHCTAQVSPTADANHRSVPDVFSISHSRTDLESSNHPNNCSKVTPTTLQVSIRKKIRTTCPETGLSHISYITSHRNTDVGSAKSRTHDAVSGNGHLNAAVTSPRHVTQFSRESKQGRGRVKNVGKHVCYQCGKQFPHHSRLKVHMRIHTGEKPYVCAQCGKRFNNDGTLRNHRRVHLQLRLYDCTVCSRSFKDAYTRRNHMRVHEKSALFLSQQANTQNT